MKTLYIGCFCEPTQMDFIYKSTHGRISISATTFQKALLFGLEESNAKFDYIVNVPDIGSFPLRCSTPFIPRANFTFASMKGVNTSFFNLTYIKRCSIYRSIMEESIAWMNTVHDEEITIIVYSLMYPYLKAAIDLKSMYPNVRVCCIVLDLPEYFTDKVSLIHSYIARYSTKKIYSLVPHIDSFVLLTEAMKDKLKVGTRPWCLIEGIYNPVSVDIQEKCSKTILYTGNLDARFGIKDLIQAFYYIDDDDFSLWICGTGLDKSYVEEAVKKDSRIKYFGLIPQPEVFKLQRKATLLVNPRKGDAEYTKYSFPSKTMEYMASGTPTIMHKLPCIPDVYAKYLILLNNDTIESFAGVMKEWGSKSQSELNRFGALARQFILDNKTSRIQAKRLSDFINTQ